MLWSKYRKLPVEGYNYYCLLYSIGVRSWTRGYPPLLLPSPPSPPVCWQKRLGMEQGIFVVKRDKFKKDSSVRWFFTNPGYLGKI